jgi:hypothetical protein
MAHFDARDVGNGIVDSGAATEREPEFTGAGLICIYH